MIYYNLLLYNMTTFNLCDFFKDHLIYFIIFIYQYILPGENVC